MASESLKIDSSFLKIRILVVDDDYTCLNVVSAGLKRWKYEVVTAIHPAVALSTLRGMQEKVDLVVIDYHMPDMNGLELQERVQNEFELPVIMMSADDSESIMLRSLEGGAVFFMVKPIHPEELKNVWQYAIKGKGGKSNLVERSARSIQGGLPRLADEGTSSFQDHQHYADQDAKSASSSLNLIIRDDNHPGHTMTQNSRTCNEDSGKQPHVQEKKVKDKGQSSEKQKKKEYSNAAPRKSKVIWTTALHHRFLHALSLVGVERAVPRRILDLMNVPGLKRSNVASHLQKYRIFLKQVEENAAHNCTALTGLPSMLGNNFETNQDILDISIPRPLETFQPDYQGTFSIQNHYQSHHTSLFPRKVPLNGSSLSKFGLLRSPNCSLPTTFHRAGSWKQPTMGGRSIHSGLYRPGSSLTTAPMNQANSSDPRNLHLMGNYISHDSRYSAQSLGNNMSQMHHQGSLLAPKLYASRMLRYGLGAGGTSNPDSRFGGKGSLANCAAPTSLLEPKGSSNYAGIQFSGNERIQALGLAQSAGIAAQINGTEVGFGSIRGTPPCIEKITPFGQGTSNGTYFAPPEPSTSAFWLASSSGFHTVNDQGNGSSKNEENLSAIDEMVKKVLGTSGNISDQQIYGKGSSNCFPSQQVNYQWALPSQDRGRNPILDVANGPYQAEVNAQRKEVVNSEICQSYGGKGNSSVWNKASLEQYAGIHNGDSSGSEIPALPAYSLPICDENPNWQANLVSQDQATGHILNSATYDTMQSAKSLTADAFDQDKGWEDDFIESLLKDVAPYLED